MQGSTSEYPVIKRFYQIFIIFQRGSGDTSQRATILFGDHDILRHIHQTTG